jgi:hypothetical protein
MLQLSILSSWLGIIALVLGWYQKAGLNLELGRTLFIGFLGVAILTFILSLAWKGRSRPSGAS